VNNENLTNLKSFSDSDPNSAAEEQFTSKQLQGYFDKKRKHRYTKKLDKEFNLRKQGAQGAIVKKHPSSIIRFLLVASAAILMASAVYFIFIGRSSQDGTNLYAYKNELYTPMDANVRGNLSDQQQLINTLFTAYENKNFSAVITEYQKFKSTDAPYDLNVEQMAGIAYGSLDNYEQAITIFNGILSTPESSYSNHSTVRYLLGLVYLLNEDKVNAKRILEEVKVGDYKYEEVQKILQGI